MPRTAQSIGSPSVSADTVESEGAVLAAGPAMPVVCGSDLGGEGLVARLFAGGAFLGQFAHDEPHHQDHGGENPRVGLVDEQRNLNRRHQHERPEHHRRARCRFESGMVLSVLVAPRLHAIAPTTPTAYRSASPDTSLTSSTSAAGMRVAMIVPTCGTP